MATLTRLAPWIALGLMLAVPFGLAGAIVGAALLAAAEAFQYLRDARAIDGANAMALARRSADAEAQSARLAEIERQLREALTPERMAMAKDMLARKLGRG